MTIVTNSVEETENAGAALAEKLPDGAVVALYGGLGAGKTAFVRGLARGLGIEDGVSSPTFTIVNEYAGANRELFHFDMYRLQSGEELFGIGWEDYLARGGVCAVEWSENVEEALDGGEVIVSIEPVSDTCRRICIRFPGGEEKEGE